MNKIKHICRLCGITTTEWDKHQNTKRHEKKLSRLLGYFDMESLKALRVGKETPLFQFLPRRKASDLNYNWRKND